MKELGCVWKNPNVELFAIYLVASRWKKPMQYLLNFVPCILLLSIGNSLGATVVWQDTIPPVSEVPADIVYEAVESYSQVAIANSDCFILSRNGKYGLTCSGQQILPIEYDIDRNIAGKIYAFRNGATCAIYDVQENRWVLPPDYFQLKFAGEHHLIVGYANHQQLIDLKGANILSTNYKKIEYLGQNDLFSVSAKTESGLKKGLFSIAKNALLLAIQFDEIAAISNSTFLRVKDKNGYRLYDPVDNIWGINRYDKILQCLWTKEAKVIVKKNEHYGVVNLNEDTIIPIRYSSIKELKLHGSMLFTGVSDEDNTIAFTENGALAYEGADNIEYLSFNNLKVTKSEKHGVATMVNDSFRMLLDVEYDEISSAFGVTIVQKDDKYNIFCGRTSEINSDLPFEEVTQLETRVIIVKRNGYLAAFSTLSCELSQPTTFTSFEYLKQNYVTAKSYHYMKARSGDGPYYLTNSKLNLKSQETFHDILFAKNHYIFFEDKDGKIGVYDGLKAVYVMDASFDSVELDNREIYLTKDGQSGIFRNGEVSYE